MTAKKLVAMTLKEVLEHPVAIDILDRSRDINKTLEEVQGWWGYDLFKRKPGAAYFENGIFHTTDLDLACFLYSLMGRGAVINIPTYKSRTKTQVREDQKVTSKDNRHGEVIGLSANKNFFSFSIRIKDQNVIGEDQVGFPRNFMLTDYDGSWYEGWKRIEFVPTLKENRFITENQLWTGNTIYFENFVSPNRWVSLFGHHYVLTKMLINRLAEEASHANALVRDMIEAGIKFPESEGPQHAEGGYTYGKTFPMKFDAVEVKIQHPAIEGAYPSVESTQENLVEMYKKQNVYSRSIIPRLRFMTRATELAHHQHPDRFPTWFQNAKWESDYKESSKARTRWDRLVLFQPGVGQTGFSILKRVYKKTAQVAE